VALKEESRRTRRIREHDVVRVAHLKERGRSFYGSEDVKRPPQIGDVATVCHEYDSDDPSTKVAVEKVTEDGLTVWLADFDQDELEHVEEGIVNR